MGRSDIDISHAELHQRIHQLVVEQLNYVIGAHSMPVGNDM